MKSEAVEIVTVNAEVVHIKPFFPCLNSMSLSQESLSPHKAKNSLQSSCWILYLKFQEYSRSFQEQEIEFSRNRNLGKKISMPYIVLQCFLC